MYIKEMKENMICLCDDCINAIRSRGEKVWELESVEDFDDCLDGDDIQSLPKCEWCDYGTEVEDEQIYFPELKVCIFP